LLGVLAGGVASLAGCLGGDDAFDDPVTEETTRPAPTTTFPRSEPGTVYRCGGPSISVSESFTDEPGYDDDISYAPSNESVKVVAGRSGDEPAWFETLTFAEWGAIESARVGLERAREVTAERLQSRRFSASVSEPPEGADATSPVITFSVETHLAGEQRITPAVPARRLAARAPHAVEATVTLDGDPFSRSVPVYAVHETVGGR
jgi:hypothetical protein